MNNIHIISQKKINEITKKIIKNKTKINIKITTIKQIQNLNKKYRKINKPTDILTFNNKTNKKNIIIDIILCFKMIKNLTLEEIITHGILHSIKYRHTKLKENKIMKKLQLKIGMSGIEPPTITTSK